MQVVEVSINGEPARFPPATSVEAALRSSGYTLAHAAVALNDSFLPRDEYARQLRDGDALEVLTPFAGG